ncbi:hypothetical protein ADUPG1_008391 [Aduncisulcus paluster]|uniref:HAT C-terminal dimerisation domain-containing protein n=1 Tax=Aduncisulcus paluster TaxID=2918883 RepID=A0ABQ5KRT7_9EUKA|nr:hypothetical protein ADUPG1_008391 [Aduncisulcus paluster]
MTGYVKNFRYVGTREYLDERVKALERNANYFKESCFFLSLDVLRTSESPTRFGVFTVFEKGCVKILKDSTSSGIIPYTQKALKGKALTYLSIPPSGAQVERVFSTYNDVLDKKRMRMSQKTKEMCLISASNGKK